MPLEPAFKPARLLRSGRAARAALIGLAVLATALPASAELLVSQLIVELKPSGQRISDVEVTNNSPERSYILIEPSEVLDPGTAAERRVAVPDPAKLGLLVSPARVILEPKQRRTLRIALVGAPTGRERVYRVTVKPVVGDLAGNESGLKLLVGYDLLVLARPRAITRDIQAQRNGRELTLSNSGNASVEVLDGRQCDETGSNCQSLPGKRLYAGAKWKMTLPLSTGGEYRIRSADGWSTLRF